MKKKIYVLNQRQGETYDAAGKAMRDVFAVLKEQNARVIWSMPKRCSRYLKALDLPYLALYLLFCVGRRGMVFYSIPDNYVKIKLLKKIQRIKGFEIICFINDLNAFRYGSMGRAELTREAGEELDAVRAANHVLVPNRNTKKMFEDAGLANHFVPIGIWDYLMSEAQADRLDEQAAAADCEPGTTRIAFAGNLDKSGFLTVMEVPPGIQMELWGRISLDRKKLLPEGCHYNGVLSSEEIPMAICGMDYGLVWDGEGRDAIEGGLGEYLRCNNSHKCALYLASGLPVIVWSESGMAHFVREHGCGVVIDRLGDLAGQLQGADYESLKEQAKKVAPQLRKGFYLKRALDAVCDV